MYYNIYIVYIAQNNIEAPGLASIFKIRKCLFHFLSINLGNNLFFSIIAYNDIEDRIVILAKHLYKVPNLQKLNLSNISIYIYIINLVHNNIGCIAGSKLVKNLKYVRDLRELDLGTRD